MTESIPKKPLKKGSLVFIDRSIYDKSVEALASDQDYLVIYLKALGKF